MNTFAVFGNPIKHSRSAEIYALFANSVGISGDYDLKLVSQEQFSNKLQDFFKNEGLGANITVPFKEHALHLCHHLTDRAIMSRAVNTIKKECDGSLLGDNTDGAGFINDLKRLDWINVSNLVVNFQSNFNINYLIKRILLIGSGGAAKGIIPVLLDIPGCYITVVNRTFVNAQKLVQYYYCIGRQNISYVKLDNLFEESNHYRYDIIINATSSSMQNDIPNIPSCLINYYTKCYDLFYQKQDTLFIKWCKDHGSNYCADGLGMLVEQAACSFYLWHGVLPNTDSVLCYLKSAY